MKGFLVLLAAVSLLSGCGTHTGGLRFSSDVLSPATTGAIAENLIGAHQSLDSLIRSPAGTGDSFKQRMEAKFTVNDGSSVTYSSEATVGARFGVWVPKEEVRRKWEQTEALRRERESLSRRRGYSK